ncbi:MAG: YIP1 family protein [Pseudomonadota bacterium]
MNLTTLLKLPISAGDGWVELARNPPALSKLFGAIVLPLSLLPPVMLYFAGTHTPEAFLPGGAGRNWALMALVFYLTEVLTVLGMGWLIRQVADTNGLSLSYRQAYLLAGVAPIPLWLSSLGLAVPDLTFNVLLSTAAMGLSCGIIYHGVQAFCRTREEVVAAAIVQTVIGAGLIAWALLLVLALL